MPGMPGRQGKAAVGVLQLWRGRELGCRPLGVDSSWGKDSSCPELGVRTHLHREGG